MPYMIMEYLILSCQLTIADEVVNSYWSHLESVNDAWAISTQEWRRAVGGGVWPLGLYGDEAALGLITDPYLKIYGIFMSVVLFRPTATRLSRFLLFSVESDKIKSVEETIYPALEMITASFNRLTAEGIRGRYFLVSELRGDQAFFRYVFKHSSWWKASEICFRCSASSKPTNLNYCVYEARDSWNTTYRSTQDFIGYELPHDNPCILDLQ